jgi:predicted SnoaL-like aldol condensation-catalyzing enzyme
MSQTMQERNKALVLEAFDTLFNKRDYEAAERFWSPSYIQHSAHIAPGREGLFNLIKSLLGLSLFKRRCNCSTRVRSRAAGWELAGRLVPLVDPRRLLPPQHAGDDLRDSLGARGRGS